MDKNCIEITSITNGVSYINIKNADIRILCGTPSDVIKLLIKKDVITSKTEDGFFVESGPNVILLSELTLQNFSFSNLCEFPVLQMLYRQGMIIPNHPNNNGIKPIIMGLKEQVDSQAEYIFRGNYGLISEEEITEAGIDGKIAKDMMSMKLKFAFGKIKESHELIKCIYLDDNKKTEISNKVFIQREELNEYKISFNNEEINVNLNLESNTSYEIPYELDYHKINKSYFSIIHSGQDDGWSIKNPSMASVISFQGKIYLIDAGPNIQNVLLHLGIGLNDIDGIFHTHGHDDHFAGITELLKIDHRIKYYSTKLIRISVMKKLSALLDISQERLDNCFEYIDLEFDKWNYVDGLEVKPIFSPHPIENNVFIFRTFWLNGFRTYAHMADLTSFDVLDSMIIDETNKIGITQEFNKKTKENYLQRVTLKKIDIGGGMIHGKLEDFASDESDKIVIAHTSTSKYTKEELKNATKVDFGDVEELIPAKKDYLRHSVAYYIKDLFPTILKSKIQVLLNCEIKSFEPNSIMINENEKNEDIYLILSGAIESNSSYTKTIKTIFSGTLIGDISAMTQNESNETYKTLSYVNALVIPNDVYTHYVGFDYLSEILMQRISLGVVFENFAIFNEFLSINTQNKITKSLNILNINNEEELELKDSGLYLLVNGTLEIEDKNKKIILLEKNKSFAYESIFENNHIYKYKAVENCEIYVIPRSTIETIPILYLKAYSSYQKIKRLHI